MALRTEKSARNALATSYLRSVKAARLDGIGYREISAASGINFDRLKQLMRNMSEWSMDDFLATANALGVDDAEALRALSEIVEKDRV